MLSLNLGREKHSVKKDTDNLRRIPPVVSEGYEPKGKYTTINGLKTCKCVPESANYSN